MKVIIHTNENGNVSITIPTGEISIEEVLAKDTPDHAIIIDDSELPNEHNEFFDAWELADNKIIINLNKAKEITKSRLRTERISLLNVLDAKFMRNLEQGLDNSKIVAEKERLRNITNLVDDAKTLDELKTITIEEK